MASVVYGQSETWPDEPIAGFDVKIRLHTEDGDNLLESPARVRDLIGAALERVGVEEEIDFTLEVVRVHSRT